MALGTWHIKRRRLKLNTNNNTSQSQSQRGVLSVDKKVTLPMSVKLDDHNPCPSMLEHLFSMLITCLEKDSSGKIKVMFLGPPNKNRPKKIWVAKSLVEKVRALNKFGFLKLDLLCIGELQDRWKSLGN